MADSGAVEKLAIGIAEIANRARGEGIRVEESVIWITRIGNVYLTYQVRLIRIGASCEGEIVGALADRDREPPGKPSDTGQAPALGKAFRCARESLVKRQCPSVAEYEIVSGIERGQGSSQAWILKVYPLPESRRVINGF